MEDQLIKSGSLLSERDLVRVAAVIEQATAENTKAAYRKDLAYFWTWAAAALGIEQAYPVAVEVLVKFIVDHAGAMDAAVDQALVDAGVKQRTGPHSVSTINRRISSVSMAHKFQGIKDEANPCRAEAVRLLLSKVRRASVKGGWRPAKKKAATLDLLFTLLSTCGTEKMIDFRESGAALFRLFLRGPAP